MLSITFLGHQGWLFATEHTRILVDPLLVEPFGHGGLVGRVYPPRAWDFPSIPSVDAVVLTHEHEDHFNIPTLCKLNRRVPIVMSRRSSVAARRILSEMGFPAVHLADGGQTLGAGDLEVDFFRPDHIATNNTDEWDVLQYLVRSPHGSFYSGVDCETARATFAGLKQRLPSVSVWCYTNNAMDWGMLNGGEALLEDGLTNTAFATHVMQTQANLEQEGRLPVASLFCGGGMSFAGERAVFNQSCFPVDSTKVAEVMTVLWPDQVFLHPRPGQTIRLSDGRIQSIGLTAPFLATPPESEWPSRAYRRRLDLLESYEPACGRTDLSEEELAELTEHLREFAQYLYTGRLYRSLYSITPEELDGRKSALALVLLADNEGGSYTLEYEPQSCSFVPSSAERPAARRRVEPAANPRRLPVKRIAGRRRAKLRAAERQDCPLERQRCRSIRLSACRSTPSCCRACRSTPSCFRRYRCRPSC